MTEIILYVSSDLIGGTLEGLDKWGLGSRTTRQNCCSARVTPTSATMGKLKTRRLSPELLAPDPVHLLGLHQLKQTSYTLPLDTNDCL